MKKIRILLFDLDPQNGSGADLQKLLEAGAAPLEIKYRPITVRELPQAARRLCSILSRFSPQLTCLVIGSTSRDRVAELFAAVRAGRAAQPVIAVVNTGDPKDVAAGLYHGANDFLIPPFRGAEVFPRIMRWVDEGRQEDASSQSLKAEDRVRLKKFVGESPALLAEISKIPVFAHSACNVLIAGEG